MNTTRKIMVAVAFTEYSAELLDYAAGIADSIGAEMIVVNIINSRDVEAVGTIAAMGYELDSKQYVSGIEADTFCFQSRSSGRRAAKNRP